MPSFSSRAVRAQQRLVRQVLSDANYRRAIGRAVRKHVRGRFVLRFRRQSLRIDTLPYECNDWAQTDGTTCWLNA